MRKLAVYISNRSFHLYRSNANLFRRMITSGWRIVTMTGYDQVYTDKLVDLGCEHITLPIDRRLVSPISDYQCKKRLAKILNALRPDLLHVYNPKIIWLIAAVLKCLDQPPLSICTSTGLGFSHESSFKNEFLVRLYRHACKEYDVLVFENQADLTRICAHYSLQPKAHLMRAAGVLLDQYKYTKHVKSAKIRFLYASRLLWSKGFRELLTSLHELQPYADLFECHVYGMVEGHHRDAVPQEVIAQAEKKSLIVYKGCVSCDEMPTIYEASDVVILPSYREGFSRVLMEAAAAGKPLITTRIPGCQEVVAEHQNGLLVPIKSSVELTRAMLFFIQQPEVIDVYGAASREIARHSFSEDALIDSHLDLYKAHGVTI